MYIRGCTHKTGFAQNVLTHSFSLFLSLYQPSSSVCRKKNDNTQTHIHIIYFYNIQVHCYSQFPPSASLPPPSHRQTAKQTSWLVRNIHERENDDLFLFSSFFYNMCFTWYTLYGLYGITTFSILKRASGFVVSEKEHQQQCYQQRKNHTITTKVVVALRIMS